MEQILREMRKVLMAGIGLVDYSVEKAQKAIEQLARRGEISAEQAKAMSAELLKKCKEKLDDCGVSDWFAQKSKQDNVIKDLEDMTDDERQAVRDALEDMMGRAHTSPAPDCACGCDTPDCACDCDIPDCACGAPDCDCGDTPDGGCE